MIYILPRKLSRTTNLPKRFQYYLIQLLVLTPDFCNGGVYEKNDKIETVCVCLRVCLCVYEREKEDSRIP